MYDEEGTEFGKSLRRFDWVHYFFKYKIFVPGLMFAGWLLKRKLVKKVPDREHMIYAQIFFESFNEAQCDWNQNFLDLLHGRVRTMEEVKKSIHNSSYKGSQGVMQLMLHMALTILVYDTAYLEFLHKFMCRVTQKMNKHYEDGNAQHLMYTSKGVNDVHYFALFPRIDGVNKKVLQKVSILKKEEEEESNV